MMRRFRSFHRDLIRRGQEHGRFRADVDPGLAAQTFVSGILGIEIQYYQDPASIELDESLEKHVDQTLAWLSAPTAARRRDSGGA